MSTEDELLEIRKVRAELAENIRGIGQFEYPRKPRVQRLNDGDYIEPEAQQLIDHIKRAHKKGRAQFFQMIETDQQLAKHESELISALGYDPPNPYKVDGSTSSHDLLFSYGIEDGVESGFTILANTRDGGQWLSDNRDFVGRIPHGEDYGLCGESEVGSLEEFNKLLRKAKIDGLLIEEEIIDLDHR